MKGYIDKVCFGHVGNFPALGNPASVNYIRINITDQMMIDHFLKTKFHKLALSLTQWDVDPFR